MPFEYRKSAPAREPGMAAETAGPAREPGQAAEKAGPAPEPSLTSETAGPAPARPFHTFAVCAYGDSPYLPACLKSLKAQTRESEIILCTATPSAYLEAMAERFDVPLQVRDGVPGIGRDWNYAFQCASGEYVTLTHQDDCYERRYTERLQRAAEKWPDMTIFSTGSITVKGHIPEPPGLPEKVKFLMRLPYLAPGICHLKAVKRLPLLLGNPVICPTVAYRKQACPEAPFSETEKFILDWDFLLHMTEQPGRFVLDPAPGIFYRVHPDAATAACIGDRTRETEESRMFRKLWPEPVARAILHFYRRSYDAYQEEN